VTAAAANANPQMGAVNIQNEVIFIKNT